MSILFGRDYKTISKHILNAFKEGELERDSVVANFATTAADGKTYQVEHYNLDVIISVGYRDFLRPNPDVKIDPPPSHHYRTEWSAWRPSD